MMLLVMCLTDDRVYPGHVYMVERLYQLLSQLPLYAQKHYPDGEEVRA
jgi:hypothetical protein